ncbi:exopolysaccharide biosynthesis protein [Pararhizobium arenae]|uniref:exopolysaccharide biosynthesis protein n=1 Tax=Pararhizobium arenae TaxID=1856850 RepID=UPI00094B770C|nr:exopolysaccharide biosynthesis protein [Pararhizobium arenae]
MTQDTADACEGGATTSVHLQQMNEEAARKGGLSVAEMVETMGSSSIAFAILVLSLPALTPIPGPFGMVFGSCLAVVSLQIMAGARHLNLPDFVGNRRMSAETIALIVRYTAPVVSKVEKLLRPGRMPQLAGPAAQRLLGFPVLLLAVAVALPIPFGNLLPVIALIIIAMALLERDGLAVLMGLAAAVLALGVTVGLLYGVFSASTWVLG